MIASQKIGKSFMGALGYNLKKLNHPDPAKRAELLDTNFTCLDNKQIAFEVDLLRQLRPGLNRYVYHTSLNFHKDDKLNNDLLLKIAHQYLEANGFNNNQYLIFRHHDADHPHLHLLVNRINFDGEVVSDSNNFKRSEQILRYIERQYNLVQVSQSKSSQLRAATKNELEKVIRTGKPSGKMLLQEVLLDILKQPKLSLQDFIRQSEAKGIHLLFNQQSTGRISGITYFIDDLKITGQKLGKRFKWAELIKQLNYEQIRDGEAISQANSRTRENYPNTAGQQGIKAGSDGLYWGSTAGASNDDRQPAANEEAGNAAYRNSERSPSTDTHPDTLYRDTDSLYHDTNDTLYHDTPEINISIADDVDDERVFRRKRRR